MHLRLYMFCQMKNLEFLFLHDNIITVIDEDTFQYNTNLKKIFLQGNRIKIIEEETFIHNTILQELNLQANNILTCYWLTHLSKTLRVLELKFPSVTNDSCLKYNKCKIYEDPVVQTTTFKLPEFEKATSFHFIENYVKGWRKDSKQPQLTSVSHVKDMPCTSCQCQIQKGIYLFEFLLTTYCFQTCVSVCPSVHGQERTLSVLVLPRRGRVCPVHVLPG